jgi:hypothetical protein
MQVMANHTPQNIRDAVAALKKAYEQGSAEFEALTAEPEVLRKAG